MGFDVDDDGECPIAIRTRHIDSISKAISKRIHELATSPRNQSTSPAFVETGARYVPRSVPELTGTNSTPTTPGRCLPKSDSQATTTCSSPELMGTAFRPETPRRDQFLNTSNPFLSASLMQDSLDDWPIPDMSERSTPPPSLSDDSESINLLRQRPRPSYTQFFGRVALPGDEDENLSTRETDDDEDSEWVH